MRIIYKNANQISAMRKAGALCASIVEQIALSVRPGAKTGDLDAIAESALQRAGAVSVTKGFPHYRDGEGYPAHCCISINEEVLHAPPGHRQLLEGDIVTIDLTLSLNGYCASRAVSLPVGSIDPARQKLIDVSEQALALAIQETRTGRLWSEVAVQIQRIVEQNGFNVVREFIGHGIGQSQMELPQVPNFVDAQASRDSFRVRSGMTFTVEPMVLSGTRSVVLREDGWTVAAADGMPAAHVRHTIAVTEKGIEILTLPPNSAF